MAGRTRHRPRTAPGAAARATRTRVRSMQSRRATIAVGLLLVGILSLGLWRVISGSEHQAFAKGATPAESYRVVAGDNYSLAVPGGVPAMLKHGIAQVAGQYGTGLGLTCEWSVNGSGNQALSVSSEQ